MTCHALLLLPEPIKKSSHTSNCPFCGGGSISRPDNAVQKALPSACGRTYCTVPTAQHGTTRGSVPSPLQPPTPQTLSVRSLSISPRHATPRTHQRACPFKGWRSAYSSSTLHTANALANASTENEMHPASSSDKKTYAREMNPSWGKKKPWRDSAQGNILLNSHNVPLQ